MELLALSSVPFHSFRKKEELIEHLKSLNKDKLVAYGLDYSLGIKSEDLNAVEYPVLLLYKDGHKGIMNDGMKKLLKKEKNVLVEQELWEAVNFLKPSEEELKGYILEGLKKAKEMGITEIHDYVDQKVAKIYFEIDLPINVVLMPYYENYREVLNLFERYGVREKLKPGWVKVYVDGSISARTAYMKEPYYDTKTRGKLLISEDRLVEIIRELERERLRVSLHAIGDGAIEVALRALEKAQISLKYHRIEHAELITEEQIKKAKELNVLLCMQPNFNCYYGDIYEKALGKDRAERINPVDLVDELGAELIFGTDMMPFDINYAVECAKKRLPEEKVIYYFGGWKYDKNYLT